jgi:hypothetical protein
MDTSQRLQVEVHFTQTASGGRKTSVDLITGSYRPHLITESSELLGVVFVQSTRPSHSQVIRQLQSLR